MTSSFPHVLSALHGSRFRHVLAALAEITRGERFERRCRELARELWAGIIEPFEFEASMNQLLKYGLESAWLLGFRDMGVKPSEMDEEERNMLSLKTMQQQAFVPAYALWIAEHNKASDWPLDAILARAALWEKLYDDFRMQARVLAGENQKMLWTLGKTEVHCAQCLALNGKVKRAKYWRAKGIHPQDPPNPKLGCQGWRCDCRLTLTDLPITPGPLPGE